MTTKILNTLRQEILSKEKELLSLKNAFAILSDIPLKRRGRRPAAIPLGITSLDKEEEKGGKKKTRKKKLGRPPGSKSKIGSKKPGPKSNTGKKAAVEMISPGKIRKRKAKRITAPIVVKSTRRGQKSNGASKSPATSILENSEGKA